MSLAQVNHTLLVLDLSHNFLDVVSVAALVDGLRDNKAMRKLRLCGALGAEQCFLLAAALPVHFFSCWDRS